MSTETNRNNPDYEESKYFRSDCYDRYFVELKKRQI